MENHIKAICCMLNMHDLIKQEATGTPDEFAKKIQISRRQLYYMIQTFKDYGASIRYDRSRRTFYYEDHFEVNINKLLLLRSNGK